MKVHISILNAASFAVAATLLLGSPGPGIAALLAVGRAQGFARGLRYFWGLQLGLAIAAAFCAMGLFAFIQALPMVMTAMLLVATLYLLWLAYKVATAPVGENFTKSGATVVATARGGFLLGITNPKSYLAFAALLASYPIAADRSQDLALKWFLCVLVMVTVDLLWLWLGVMIGRATLPAGAERAINIGMGAAIAMTTIIPLTQL